MEKYFDLTELCDVVAERSGYEKHEVREILDFAFVAIAEGIGKQGRAGLKNFGHFSLRPQKERSYLLNGKTYNVPAHLDLHFDPDPDFCTWVNDILDREDGLEVLATQG